MNYVQNHPSGIVVTHADCGAVGAREQKTESYRQLQKPLERWQAFDPTVLFERATARYSEWPRLQSWWLSD
ncbi:hypothetical protein TNCV_3951891 [Trichonephila clavipes]|nr:hypothetical protein TNCV_3951891 [Trichonephila clavipes]